MGAVLEQARRDAAVLRAGGVDGVLVENYGDVPFFAERVPAETVAALTLAVAEVRSECGDLPVGVNVLRNDASTALGIAAATGASFVRVNVHTGAMTTDQGVIQGQAAETLRLRDALCPGVAILADVHVKHATPPAGERLEDAAQDAWWRGLADGLIVSGSATGVQTDPDRVARVATAVPDAPIWIGSGATPENVSELELAGASGFIVGSALRRHGRAGEPVELERVQAFIEAVALCRGAGA
jgi:membrane complex biogenesis BtpA family protein